MGSRSSLVATSLLLTAAVVPRAPLRPYVAILAVGVLAGCASDTAPRYYPPQAVPPNYPPRSVAPDYPPQPGTRGYYPPQSVPPDYPQRPGPPDYPPQPAARTYSLPPPGPIER